MTKLKLEGLRFGKWLVIGKSSKIDRFGTIYWDCVCECGRKRQIQGSSLKQGRTKSCSFCANKRHGYEGTPTYSSWVSMRRRCIDPKSHGYANYGGRGIEVCEEWAFFEKFLSDMGERPSGTSIDRIDNDKGYFKENCRWATSKQQIRNRSISPKVEYQGEIRSLAELSEIFNVPHRRLYDRIRQGWNIEEALSTPVKYGNRWRSNTKEK